MAKQYDESTVLTLDALSHIRLRSGMYIGRLGDGSHPDDGIYVLLKEVIDNSVDEFIMKHGTEIIIDMDEATGKVSVRDFGRGIPWAKSSIASAKLIPALNITTTSSNFLWV